MTVLSKTQAKAVVRALVALESVGAHIAHHIKLPGGFSVARYDYGGGYGVSRGGRAIEEYDDLAAFAAAYGCPAT